MLPLSWGATRARVTPTAQVLRGEQIEKAQARASYAARYVDNAGVARRAASTSLIPVRIPMT